MRGWMRGLLVAAAALTALPAAAADTSAQGKDRKHEEEVRERMKERSDEKAKGFGAKVKKGADQAADAARVGGARSARTYHGGVHGGKKAVHRGAKKTADATKTK